MVGHLVDADGQPLGGVEIETVESRWKTEPDGAFAVNYKEPAQMLAFTQNNIQYTRHYQPSDDKKDVLIKVPVAVERVVRCELEANCDAELGWDLGDALTARTTFKCDGDNPVRLDAAPIPFPISAACRVDGKELPVKLLEVDGSLVIGPPPVPVSVRLSVPGSEAEHACTVSVSGQPATRNADGLWVGEGFGLVQLDAVCDGVPAVPARWYVRTPSELPLIWRPSDVTLDVHDVLPWADTLLVYALGENGGWMLQAKPGADHVYRLPALAPGSYVFAAGVRADRLLGTQQGEGGLAPDVLHLRDLPREGRVTDAPEAVGMLVRGPKPPAGAIPVQFYPADK
jgi:hypothetical protein